MVNRLKRFTIFIVRSHLMHSMVLVFSFSSLIFDVALYWLCVCACVHAHACGCVALLCSGPALFLLILFLYILHFCGYSELSSLYSWLVIYRREDIFIIWFEHSLIYSYRCQLILLGCHLSAHIIKKWWFCHSFPNIYTWYILSYQIASDSTFRRA